MPAGAVFSSDDGVVARTRSCQLWGWIEEDDRRIWWQPRLPVPSIFAPFSLCFLFPGCNSSVSISLIDFSLICSARDAIRNNKPAATRMGIS